MFKALDRSVEQYFSSSLASSTRRVYMAACNRYLKFCNYDALCTTTASKPLYPDLQKPGTIPQSKIFSIKRHKLL